MPAAGLHISIDVFCSAKFSIELYQKRHSIEMRLLFHQLLSKNYFYLKALCTFLRGLSGSLDLKSKDPEAQKGNRTKNTRDRHFFILIRFNLARTANQSR